MQISLMKTSCILSAFIMALTLSPTVWAEVKPNPLFSDGAVLQQNASVPVWGKAKDGEIVTVEFDGEKATTTAKDGKWMVKLKPHKAGGPFTLTIAGENTVTVKNVLVGEVWLCSGQSNMEFPFHYAANMATEKPMASYPNLRKFRVTRKAALQPLEEVTGQWVECSPNTVESFSAVAYFFGRDIHKATGFPVGLIESMWGQTGAQSWTSCSGLEKDQELHGYVETLKTLVNNSDQANQKYPQELADYEANLKQWKESVGNPYEQALKTWAAENEINKTAGNPLTPKPKLSAPKPQPPRVPDGGEQTPSSLYNGMIAPIIPYAIKGTIWYQGEANAGKPAEYKTLFPRMIADWREKWAQGEFPFLFVQIAPHVHMGPELREAQLLTWKKTPGTAMAVTTDVGQADDIHPRQKEPVGARLALAARALAYGEKIEYSGPEFDSMKVDQNQVILSFKHLGTGLMAKDGVLKGFTIAGADQKFVDAKAEISGDTVVVTSDQVPAPLAVRYGWSNVPDVNLYNKEGLPASPFRTDTESAK